MAARAVSRKLRKSFVPQNGLGHDGPRRVAGTEKENVIAEHSDLPFNKRSPELPKLVCCCAFQISAILAITNFGNLLTVRFLCAYKSAHESSVHLGSHGVYVGSLSDEKSACIFDRVYARRFDLNGLKPSRS